MRRHLLVALAAALPAAASAQSLTEVWRTSGLATPESAYLDAANDRIFVSNIGVFGPDGGMDGRMSILGTDGAMVAADWVTGLMDPKGMAVHEGRLYVADAVGLHVIDIAAGTLLETIALPDATFPNDVTVGPDGTLYVTDFLGGGLWQVKDGAASWLIAPGGLPLPNGVLWDGNGLIVGSFGDVMNPDFTVQNPGGLISVDPATGAVAAIAGTEGTGSVDGIGRAGDYIVYDDNPSGRIIAVGPNGVAELVVTAPGAGDLSAEGDMVVVPNLNTGEVVAYRIE